MKVAIIEDEKLTAEDLADMIREIEPEAEISKFLYSVREAVDYFTVHPAPDLVFSDIQLGDGLSFEIFNSVTVPAPIIFCTAYNEYALHAFKTNGIEYVLKPLTHQDIRSALGKYRQLSHTFSSQVVAEQVQKLFTGFPQKKANSVLVHYRDRIIPVRLEDIALFYIRNQGAFLYTFSGTSYPLSHTLDEMQQLCGDGFFRANRQFLINRNAVRDLSHHQSRKSSVYLSVPFTESITVSKEKLASLLEWLAG